MSVLNSRSVTTSFSWQNPLRKGPLMCAGAQITEPINSPELPSVQENKCARMWYYFWNLREPHKLQRTKWKKLMTWKEVSVTLQRQHARTRARPCTARECARRQPTRSAVSAVSNATRTFNWSATSESSAGPKLERLHGRASRPSVKVCDYRRADKNISEAHFTSVMCEPAER